MTIGWTTLNRLPSVLITGATGFIGSFLAAALLGQGARVIGLVRSHSDKTPLDRLVDALRLVDPKISSAVEAVSGDVTLPHGGLSKKDVADLKGRVDEIWHCAADTSFREAHRGEVLRTNHQGTVNVLDLAEAVAAPSLCFLSTAYVTSPRAKVAYEQPVKDRDDFRNPYEESKVLAENALLSLSERKGIIPTIYRLPVTTGHSQTGRCFCFSGYYYLARLFIGVRGQFIRNGWLGEGAPRFQEPEPASGRSVLPLEPILRLPVRIPCKPSATVNIIPIDVAVRAMMDCARSERDQPEIFHITNGHPPRARFLFEETTRLLGVTGLVFPGDEIPSEDDRVDATLAKVLESVLFRTQPYVPYIQGETKFSRENLSRHISTARLPDYTVDSAYLDRILNFAMARGWRPG